MREEAELPLSAVLPAFLTNPPPRPALAVMEAPAAEPSIAPAEETAENAAVEVNGRYPRRRRRRRVDTENAPADDADTAIE